MAKVVWFDIPVSDMGRAIDFYQTLTGQELTRLPVGNDKETALFGDGDDGSAGCLFVSAEDQPSHYGSRWSTSTPTRASRNGWHEQNQRAAASWSARRPSGESTATSPTSKTARAIGSA